MENINLALIFDDLERILHITNRAKALQKLSPEGNEMSESSDSYHLRSETVEEGVELLHRAHLCGFVFPANNGWVSILPGGEAFEPNKKLPEAIWIR